MVRSALAATSIFLTLALGSAVPASAQQRQEITAGTVRLTVETMTTGLDSPWGAALLPDGRLLVTEKGGTLRLIGADGSKSAPIDGVPRVQASGQGGLLGIALDPDFASNRFVYLSYSEPQSGGAGTSAGRGRLSPDGARVENFEVIFRQTPAVNSGRHFGSRLVFARDGSLFITVGDRGNQEKEAQNLSNHIGKLMRIRPNGSIPTDNPFVRQQGAKPEIWSYGHRNVQGAALHPQTGAIWLAEMGPAGGDEINIPKAGLNYGWPLVSHGNEYSGAPIPKPETRPDLANAIYQWSPVIAPGGITFVTRAIPAWRGSLLLAGLRAQGLVRVTLDGEKVTGEERIPLGARIRDVIEGPDALYVLTDGSNGRLLKITAR